jgi:cellulose synthase/poly-beta-1,6-N-acetylglucosamine synthase-like glycosyltransferase
MSQPLFSIVVPTRDRVETARHPKGDPVTAQKAGISTDAMASAKIKFNVIIPTRERMDTLRHCLRTVVAQDYDPLNIIVSDNFSQDGTREVVAEFNDPRITYVNTGRRV